MKVALLSPAGAMHRHNGSFSASLHYAPLTLTTLAALIPEELGEEVLIYDETVESIPLDTDADLIGITVITGTAPRSYRYADYFRSRGIPVVLGGVHPSLLPDEALSHADAVVTGFAENSWPRLLHDFAKGQMKRRYHQEDNFAFRRKTQPRRNLLRRWKYITTNSVEAVRGCHHACDFCAYPAVFGRRTYPRPVREVIAEIEQLPGKYVVFVDINLPTDRSFAKELFREMIVLKKKWFGLATIEIGKDEELFALIKKSGCKGLLIGFESVTNTSLRFVHKGFSRVEDYERLVEKLHDAGIAVNGTFAFGSDCEDKSVFKQTAEAVLRLKVDLPRFSLLTPFPGTLLHKKLEDQGRIIERDWAMYDAEHCVFRPLQMTPEQLEEGLQWTWKSVYSVKSIFTRIMTSGISFPLNLATNLGYQAYARKLSRFTKPVMHDNSDIPEVIMGTSRLRLLTSSRSYENYFH